jgi:hypothetical protein
LCRANLKFRAAVIRLVMKHNVLYVTLTNYRREPLDFVAALTTPALAIPGPSLCVCANGVYKLVRAFSGAH